MTNDFRTKLPSVRRALHRWYAQFGRRRLPWREGATPYQVYVSEIMLQQTQVRTVLERYYGPFLSRFPTLAALAAADGRDVLKAWEGLGYYTRAKNLHAAAQQCAGRLPATVEGLMELPGIGRNTAHAIACFGFGVPVAVMEANVKRVLCRLFALKKPDDAVLWQRAGELLDKKNAFDYNQAMMDIGAMVCTRRNPRCGECPLSTICEGKSSPESYPAAKRKKAVPVRARTIVAFQAGDGRYLLAPRATRHLTGLFGFMEYDDGVRDVALLGKTYPLHGAEMLGAVTQSYSHFTLAASVYRLPLGAARPRRLAGGMVLASLAEMDGLPLSRADHKILRLLASREA